MRQNIHNTQTPEGYICKFAHEQDTWNSHKLEGSLFLKG